MSIFIDTVNGPVPRLVVFRRLRLTAFLSAGEVWLSSVFSSVGRERILPALDGPNGRWPVHAFVDSVDLPPVGLVFSNLFPIAGLWLLGAGCGDGCYVPVGFSRLCSLAGGRLPGRRGYRIDAAPWWLGRPLACSDSGFHLTTKTRRTRKSDSIRFWILVGCYVKRPALGLRAGRGVF